MIKRILIFAFVALVPSLSFGQVIHWGDFQDGDAVPLVIDFNTLDPATGLPAAVTGLSLEVRELGTTTEDTDCITFNDDADALVGYHEASINLADTYFTANKRYSVVITAGTCGGENIFPRKVASFSTNQYASFDDDLPSVTGPPGATPTVGEGIAWLAWISQARIVTTDALKTIYAADGTTAISEEVIDDSTPNTIDKEAAGAP